MVPPSLAGFAQHVALGNVRARLAVLLAGGTLAGAYGGSNIALSAPDGALEALFCVAMVVLGRQTLRKAPRVPAHFRAGG